MLVRESAPQPPTPPRDKETPRPRPPSLSAEQGRRGETIRARTGRAIFIGGLVGVVALAALFRLFA